MWTTYSEGTGGGGGVSIEDTKGLSTKDGEEEGLALR